MTFSLSILPENITYPRWIMVLQTYWKPPPVIYRQICGIGSGLLRTFSDPFEAYGDAEPVYSLNFSTKASRLTFVPLQRQKSDSVAEGRCSNLSEDTFREYAFSFLKLNKSTKQKGLTDGSLTPVLRLIIRSSSPHWTFNLQAQLVSCFVLIMKHSKVCIHTNLFMSNFIFSNTVL